MFHSYSRGYPLGNCRSGLAMLIPERILFCAISCDVDYIHFVNAVLDINFLLQDIAEPPNHDTLTVK